MRRPRNHQWLVNTAARAGREVMIISDKKNYKYIVQSAFLYARDEPIVAYYGAPWAPALLRHDKIMLPVKSESGRADIKFNLYGRHAVLD